jgi:hypothetical protein
MSRRRFIGESIIKSFPWNPLDSPLVYLEYRRDHSPISSDNEFGNYTRPIFQPIVFIDDLEPWLS